MKQTDDQSFFDSIADDDSSFWIKGESQFLRRMVLSTIKLFEGTLFIKCSRKEFWKSRFFILYTDRLEVQKNGRDKSNVATMLLGHMYLDLKKESTDNFAITLCSCGKKFVMNARSQQSRDKWVQQLRRTCILRDYRETYVNLRVLGKGTFAKVLLAEKISNKQQFAVKTFQKSNLTEKQCKQRIGLLNEINLLRLCDHENIIQLYEIHESTEFIYLVMELSEGGELFETILNYGTFSDKQVAKIMFKIFGALAYLHSKNIMHRDLKPENIILKDKSDNFDLKLADFGLATTTLVEPVIKRCGTPGYVAPEILEDQKYDQKVDVFSAGVILHILLTGTSPFYADSLEEILENNRNCDINFDLPNVSVQAIDLLKKTLKQNPKERLSAQEALEHQFISQFYTQQVEDDEDNVMENINDDIYSASQNMKQFQTENANNLFQLKKLKQSLLVQQTPIVGINHSEKTKVDSWLVEESPVRGIDMRSPESEGSLINTPSSPLSTKPDQQVQKQTLVGGVIFRGSGEFQKALPTQQNNKKACQIRNQLKQLDF